jgi:hypothetical protein
VTTKADFEPDEWILVIEGPPLAAMHVLAAEPRDSERERVSIAKSYGEAREHLYFKASEAPQWSELLQEILAEPARVAMARVGTPEAMSSPEVTDPKLERLRTAAAAVDAKATSEECLQYRHFVLGMAQRVADAHRKGGFLGLGGKRVVTERELQALDEVAAALGVEAAEPGR